MNFLRRHWVWIIIGVVVFGWLLSSQGLRNYFVNRREYRQLDLRLRDTRKRLAEKQLRLSRAQKDDAFLEMEARRQLGLVKPDEIEFRFMSSTDAAHPGERMEKYPGGSGR
jgi:cell division protein FtsB